MADDPALALRLARGDGAAFDQLVGLYHGRVTRLAHRLLGWPEDVEDVVQEVFLAVLQSLGKFRGDASLSTWITSITLNKCRSLRRRRFSLWKLLRRRALEPAVTAPSADGPPTEDETSQQVRQAILALPQRDREVIVLHYLEHHAPVQIAEMLGLQRNAVEVRLHRARQRLRELLSDVVGDRP